MVRYTPRTTSIGNPSHDSHKGKGLFCPVSIFVFILCGLLAGVLTLSAEQNRIRPGPLAGTLATIVLCLPASWLWILELLRFSRTPQHHAGGYQGLNDALTQKRRAQVGKMASSTLGNAPTLRNTAQGGEVGAVCFRRGKNGAFVQQVVYALLLLAPFVALVSFAFKTLGLGLGLLALGIILMIHAGQYLAYRSRKSFPALICFHQGGGVIAKSNTPPWAVRDTWGRSFKNYTQPLQRWFVKQRGSVRLPRNFQRPFRKRFTQEDHHDKPSIQTVQTILREKLADGQERILAKLWVELAPGSLQAWAHVPFCPPYENLPEITVSQVAGPEARLRLLKSLPQGAAVEVKLRQPSELTTRVGIVLQAKGIPLRLTSD